MPRQSPNFIAVACDHCGALLALTPPSVWLHTTHLKCPQCQTRRTIKVLDNKEDKAYTESAPVLVPA